ncbi:MAG TPA: ABC transporter permease [Ilumatobacter sp.]|nr:ABC transporter permease [Ilumatobacter sp.]
MTTVEIPTGDAPAATRPKTAARRSFVRRFAEQRVAMAALTLLALIVIAAVFASSLAPHPPNAQNLRNILKGPGSDGHLLGTDHLGRDVLSRLIYGARFSLLASVEAVGVGLLIGFLPGLLAGYIGGKVDWCVMRVIEALMAFPPIILAIAVVASLGPGLTNAMIAVGVVFAPRFARMTRDATLSVREETFVEAARSMGLRRSTILRRHVVPHVLSPLIVMTTVLAGVAMIVEAGLSYVGLGAVPPDSSWGTMLAGSIRYTTNSPLLIVWPGLCVVVCVVCLNLIGDGIKDSVGREARGKISR